MNSETINSKNKNERINEANTCTSQGYARVKTGPKRPLFMCKILMNKHSTGV